MPPNEPETGKAKLKVRPETVFRLIRLFTILMVPLALFVGLLGLLPRHRLPDVLPGLAPLPRMSDADAREKLKRADELAAAGKLAESARLGQEVAEGPSSAAMAAKAVEQVRARGATVCDGRRGARAGRRSADRGGASAHRPMARAGRNSLQAGAELVRQRQSTDPAGALEILEAIAPMAPKGDGLNELRP